MPRIPGADRRPLGTLPVGATAPVASQEGQGFMDQQRLHPAQPDARSPEADPAKPDPPQGNRQGDGGGEGSRPSGSQTGFVAGSAAADDTSSHPAVSAVPETPLGQQEAVAASEQAASASSAGTSGRRRSGRPSTLEEYDQRIEQTIRQRQQFLVGQRREAKRRDKDRVEALGGALLGAARRGNQAAVELLEAFVADLSQASKQVPERDSAFVDWDWRDHTPKAAVTWVKRTTGKRA